MLTTHQLTHPLTYPLSRILLLTHAHNPLFPLGDHIANFYLDPYSRPAEKRGGAWMDVCIGKSKIMNRKPVAYLVCNGSPPVGDQPSLMTFREVETLFHEFGHGLQVTNNNLPKLILTKLALTKLQ